MWDSGNKKEVESMNCDNCVLKKNVITRPVSFLVLKVYPFIDFSASPSSILLTYGFPGG